MFTTAIRKLSLTALSFAALGTAAAALGGGSAIAEELSGPGVASGGTFRLTFQGQTTAAIGESVQREMKIEAGDGSAIAYESEEHGQICSSADPDFCYEPQAAPANGDNKILVRGRVTGWF